jgi:HPt (histidine-containing phosphotransfer) domain-containing protein
MFVNLAVQVDRRRNTVRHMKSFRAPSPAAAFSQSDTRVFLDATVLRTSLETNDPEILSAFYEMFLDLVEEISRRLKPNQPVPVIRHLSHKLKGGSESVGAMALTAALNDLERATVRKDHADISEHVAVVGALMIATIQAIRKHMTSLIETSKATAARDTAPEPKHLFDASVLPAFLETEHPDTLRKFYLLFLEVARDTWQQMELALQQERPDPFLLRRLAHRLKSSSASIGANALAATLQQLERVAEGDDQAVISETVALVGGLVNSTVEVILQHLDAAPLSSAP